MNQFKRLPLLTVLLLAFFLSYCQKSSNPAPKQTVEIQDVTTSNEVNMDGDNFYSSFRLNFFLDLNTGSKEVDLVLAVRFYDPADTATYYQYFEASGLVLESDGSNNSWYIQIPPTQTDDHWLPQAVYDFLLIVFDADEPDTRMDEVSASDLSALQGIPIEPAENDVGVMIYDAWFQDGVDVDGDSYDSEIWLWCDADATTGNSAYLNFFYYYRPTGTSDYTSIGYVGPHQVTGGTSGDALGVKITDVQNFPHDAYDFRVEILHDESIFIEDYADASNDGSLSNVLLELPGEDVVTQTIYFWDVDVYQTTDNDGDGYFRSIVYEVDADASTGSADVYLGVWSKGYLDANYTYLGNTNVFTITGSNVSDVYYVEFTSNIQTMFDFRFTLHYSGSAVVQDTRDASNDGDMNNVPLEDDSTD